MQKIALAITLVLAAGAVAVTLALPANAAPPDTGGGYSSNGMWSPYGVDQGAPQNEGAGGT